MSALRLAAGLAGLALALPTLARAGDEDLPRLQVVREVDGMDNHVNALAVSAAGDVAVGDCDGLLRLLAPDLRTWRATLQPAEAGHARCVFPGAVCFDRAGERVLCGDRRGRLQEFDVGRGGRRRDVPAHEGPVRGVALAPDGASLVSCGRDGRVLRWDLETLAATLVVQREVPVGCVAFTASGSLALGEGPGPEGGRVAVLAPGGASRGERLIAGAAVGGVAPGPRGTLLVTTSRGEVLRFPSEALHEPAGVLPRPAPRAMANGLALHPGGRVCAVCYRVGPRGLLVLWDLERGEELQRFELLHFVADAAVWTRDGSHLVVCGGSTYVVILGP